MGTLIHITESCTIKNGSIVQQKKALQFAINEAITAALIERQKIKEDIKELNALCERLKEEDEAEKFMIEFSTFGDEYSPEFIKKVIDYNERKRKIKNDLDTNTEILYALDEQQKTITDEL